MRKTTKRIVALLCVFVLAFGLMTVTAGAASKVKKLKNVTFDTSISYINKHATTLKKGTHKLKIGSGGRGFVRFKAPKTATYTFTFSNMKSSRLIYGHYYLMKKGSYGTYALTQKVKTNGGKTTALLIGSKNSSTSDKLNQYRTNRYGKMKVKKGQWAYIYFSTTSGSVTFNFKIK